MASIPNLTNNLVRLGQAESKPILTMGSPIEGVTWPDGWTTVTADGLPAAQFEHTILITKTGAEVLTEF
ncbi:Methionine aminopeptidase 1C, chloroplastic/mitochondrial [Apostasia shenzhenica]|uniref:Methionine aminopeptidase 1C, chloroplastic/mitochondrial n=1 Tax=Apostasia shenzhenica TaxID=1088818 RepID=A0A2I0ARD6_9ASPA|nr:Methionine aminopeptidase 1C, chloroplastic/mitochondrial [Apostasia shenzhenica]